MGQDSFTETTRSLFEEDFSAKLSLDASVQTCWEEVLKNAF